MNRTFKAKGAPSIKRRRQALRVALVTLLLVAAACGGKEPVRPASLILTNAAVYTMDPSHPWAEAVAVEGKTILYAGDARGAVRFRGPQTRALDLGGRMVLPAFQDSHIHLVSGGIELGQCNLNGLQTKEDVLAAVRDYAARHPGTGWIVGGGWDLPLFPGANPSKDMLDAIAPPPTATRPGSTRGP
jgi:predicted amidohydrolase YtcJ